MPNGFEQFAQNAMAFGEQIRARQKEHRLASALQTFDQDPSGAIANVTKVDPVVGWNMRRQMESDQQAKQAALEEHTKNVLSTVTSFLRPAAMDPAKTPQSLSTAFDSILPVLHDGLGMQPDEIAKWKQMFVTNPSIVDQIDNKFQIVPPGAAVTRGGKEVYRNPAAMKTIQVRRGDGGYDVITVDPNGNPVGTSTPPGTGAPVPASASTAGGRTTVDQAWGFTSPHEGGYAAHDANGAPVNHGINQAANPGVDVKNLTDAGAKQIFETKYFVPSGAANMPPALGVLHADTYYMNPKRAMQFEQQSGGDPQKYLQLRAQWQDELVRKNPQKYGKYADAWHSRNVALAGMIGGGGGGGGDAQPQAGGGVTPVYRTPGKAAGSGSRVLTAEEVQKNNLNPNVVWQFDHNGEIKLVGPANQMSSPKGGKNDPSKVDEQYSLVNSALDRMSAQANTLLNHPGLERSVGVGSYFPSIHGGKAADFEKQLNALKSQIALSVLQNMRLASPTGGAMGRVTNYEMQQLQNDIAALDLGGSPTLMRQGLKNIVDYAAHTKELFARARNLQSQGGAVQGGTMAVPNEAADTLRANPSPQRRQQFDQVFGQGAAKKVLGGN